MDKLKIKTQLPKAFLEQNTFWEELLTKLPKELWQFFAERDGAEQFVKKLPELFSPEDVANEKSGKRRTWELVGLFYFNVGRFHEALLIFTYLYYHMLDAQERTRTWCCKAVPLVWMSECFLGMGAPFIAKRYLMLTLCEDAIAAKGDGSNLAKNTGVYFRLVWGSGLSDTALKNYAKMAYDFHIQNQTDGLFPEWILQDLSKD